MNYIIETFKNMRDKRKEQTNIVNQLLIQKGAAMVGLISIISLVNSILIFVSAGIRFGILGVVTALVIWEVLGVCSYQVGEHECTRKPGLFVAMLIAGSLFTLAVMIFILSINSLENMTVLMLYLSVLIFSQIARTIQKTC